VRDYTTSSMSKEMLGLILGIGSFVVTLALYLVDKSSRTLPLWGIVALLVLLAVLSFTGLLLIPWFSQAPSKLETVWRISLAAAVIW